MKKDNTKLIEIILITMVAVLVITAVVGIYQFIKSSSSKSNNNNQQSVSQQLKNPNVNVNIPSPIISLSAGENGATVNAGTPITITCQGSASYNCNIVIKSNTSTQTIEFPSQGIVDNGNGQSFTSWQWVAISGKWTLTSYLSNSEGQSSLSPSNPINVN